MLFSFLLPCSSFFSPATGTSPSSCLSTHVRFLFPSAMLFLLRFFVTFFFVHFSHTSTFQLLDKPWSQVSSLLPPRFLPPFFIAHRVQQSHCSSMFHRMLLTHALALSASQFVHKKKSQRICTRMHLAGLKLTKLTYTRLEDYLKCHRGDGQII